MEQRELYQEYQVAKMVQNSRTRVFTGHNALRTNETLDQSPDHMKLRESMMKDS